MLSSGIYIDPFLKRQKIEDMPPKEFLSIPISDLNQTSQLVAGPGAKRDVAASILGVALPKVSRRDQEDVSKAKKYAMEQSIKYVLQKQTLVHQQQQAKSLQRHQALVLMCRVYIGSISFELREDTIRQAFAPFGPIKTINMSWDPVAQKHKGFAFVEYDLPEAAQLALEQMNGVMIGGRNIKCGRDTRIKFSHMDEVIEELMEEARSFNRIYVSAIHLDLSEDDIKSVFEAFGKIRICKLAPGSSPGKHRGYGFLEYEQSHSSTEAIASMNLFDLGGQYLRVGKAITPPNALQSAPGQSVMPTAAAVAAAAATAKIQAMEAVSSTAAALGLTKEPPANMNPIINNPLGGVGNYMGGSTKYESLASAPIVPPTVLPPPGLAIPGYGILPSGLGPNVAIVHPTLSAPLSSLHHQLQNTSDPMSLQDHNPFSTANMRANAAAVADQFQLADRESENESVSLSSQENLSIKGTSSRHLMMQKLMRGVEGSPVLLLKNMVSEEEVDETLEEEITEECSHYGRVRRVVIYHDNQTIPPNVKIFVEFLSPPEAESARQALNGRFFAGRKVVGEIYDFSMYKLNHLSG